MSQRKYKFIKAVIILHIILFLSCLYKYSSAENSIHSISVIDTPTAYTIGKGTYQFDFLAYDSGGLETKAFIGLHDSFYLGASFDIQNALGKEKPELHAPGVITKLKITDGWDSFPISFAIGYDSFYIGEEGRTYNNKNKLNRMIYGPYFVVTKPIYLLDDEQHFHFGMRVPLQPYYVPGDTSYFVSIDIPIKDSIIFKTESERIYYDFSRPGEWLFNIGLKYSYMNRLGVEFDVLLQKHDRANRILRIEYNNEF